MKLSSYLAEHIISDEDFAAKVKCDRTTILRLRAEKQRPSHSLMERIASETGGLVQPNDFFDLPEADAA